MGKHNKRRRQQREANIIGQVTGEAPIEETEVIEPEAEAEAVEPDAQEATSEPDIETTNESEWPAWPEEQETAQPIGEVEMDEPEVDETLTEEPDPFAELAEELQTDEEFPESQADVSEENMPAKDETIRDNAETEEPEEYDDVDYERPQIKKTLLFAGILLAMLGTMGILGLRLGIIQAMFGYTASPSIGSEEAQLLVVSSVPLTLGLMAIGFWGVRSERIYQSIYGEVEDVEEEAEEDETAPAEDFERIDEQEILDTYAEPHPEPVEEEQVEEYLPIDENIKLVLMKEEETVAKDAGMFENLEDEMDHLIEASGIGQKEVPKEFQQPMDELLQELENDEELALEIARLSESDSMPELERDGPAITGSDLKKFLADELRVERCEKMLSAVVVLPDDKNRLKELVDGGISPTELANEIEKAVDRRKRKEKDRAITSDEKASILEDELLAELAEMEEDLVESNGDDDDDLEDRILKEIEDLEDLE